MQTKCDLLNGTNSFKEEVETLVETGSIHGQFIKVCNIAQKGDTVFLDVLITLIFCLFYKVNGL